ncbi:hypothetical protein AAE478_009003 [Parahypoxylon ruwenzoriense]
MSPRNTFELQRLAIMAKAAAAKAAARILHHNEVSMCVIGKLALAYYNVPVQFNFCDIEICVAQQSFYAASSILCSTGLFEPCQPHPESGNYLERMLYPHVKTTQWTHTPQVIVILPSTVMTLGGIDELIPLMSGSIRHCISECIYDFCNGDIADLRFPRLPLLIRGLANKVITEADTDAMASITQLVDGMNLDEEWLMRNISGLGPAVESLILNEIRSKELRVGLTPGKKITRFVRDSECAVWLKRIAGYE